MIKLIIWFVVILVIGLSLFLLLKYFKKIRLDYIMLFSGGVGCGKTSLSVAQLFYILRKVYLIYATNILNKNRKDYIIMSNFPIGKWDKKREKRFIRIFFKKIWCYDLDIDVLTLQKRIPQNEVIYIVDEFSQIASQFDFNAPVVKDNMDEFFRLFRHYHNGKAYFIAIDQCSENIFLQIRRRASYTYNLIKCFKVPLIPLCIYTYRKILISDEVDNIIESKDATNETELLKFIRFCNPFKWYDSFCHSERYKKIPLLENYRVSKSLKRNDSMKINKKVPLYYKTLEYDNISKDEYNLQYQKNKK